MICNSTTTQTTALGITTTNETQNCFESSSTINYEYQQAWIQTHYYFQFTLDGLLIIVIAIGIAKIILWRNWITEMIKGVFKKLK